MTAIDSARLIKMVAAIADRMEAEKDRLCALDGIIGDADHGIAMALGFGAARDATAALDPATADPATVLNTTAKAFLNAVGASSGPLYATAFMRAAATVKGKQALDDADVAPMLAAMAKGIQDRGKAELGEKTMLDAWLPAADAATARAGEGGSRADVMEAAVAAAQAGAEATKDMIAGKGRSSRLGERARGHMDPGAASAVVIVDAMRGSLA